MLLSNFFRVKLYIFNLAPIEAEMLDMNAKGPGFEKNQI